jgi:L-threonylcarbamoyladenylate synthase
VTHDWRLKQAARVLGRGGIVAYPTEAVYGLGCNPLDRDAVQRLLRLKGRRTDKGLILIAAEISQIERFLAPVAPEIMQRVLAAWPGPVTWLWPARKDCPRWLTGAHHTLAVRVTAHPLAADLCREAGMALVSTSANRSGRPPARAALSVRRSFGHALDFVLAGPVGGLAKPTEIRDALTGAVVRAG